jgi:hypothetical protein
MSHWKWVLAAFGVVIACVAAVIILRSVQRNRDLAETTSLDGPDLQFLTRVETNLGQGHGREIHYLRNGQYEEVTQKFKMNVVRLGGCSIAINSETLPEGIYAEMPSTNKYTMSLCDIDPESIKIKTYDLHKDVFSCDDRDQVKLYELNCDNAEIEFLTRNGATAEDVKTFTRHRKGPRAKNHRSRPPPVI